ncbi:outer membrane protein [Caulobacter sp. Root487D2Y]|uniref:outer membrane protein n=1 Tax=Caulobacter sp. Root487D2Y TaxID=1736547 RepID=UPI0009EB04E0|nr:outer membrane beta-barrel protein [Caulobacter sp. Root487D2Y]
MKVAVVLGCAVALAATAVQARADDLTFRMGTYVWLPSVEGPLGLESDRPTPVVGDGNILDNLQFFGFGVAELSGDRFGALVDFAYVDIGFGHDVELPPQIPLEPDLSTKAMVGTVSAYYRVVDGENWDVDLTGGIRGFWLETDFTLSAPNTTLIDAGGDTNWIDGVIGARARGQYGRWGLTGQIDSGWGSDTSSWQGQALVEYDLSNRWRLMGGYRYLHLENDKRRVDVDLDLKGPLFGFTYRF